MHAEVLSERGGEAEAEEAEERLRDEQKTRVALGLAQQGVRRGREARALGGSVEKKGRF